MNTQETITKCIVLRTVDYQESDKILTLFSVDLGKLSATLKGCRKAGAKLKYVGQPFCFAEFSLVKRGENFVVTNAGEIETFFSITQDYENLKYASAMLEMATLVLNEGEPNTGLFLVLLKSLKEISEKPNQTSKVFIKFMLELFKNTGYALEFSHCSQCGGEFGTKVLFDFDLGNFVCGLCKGNFCVDASLKALGSFKLIDSTPLEKLETVKVLDSVFAEMLTILNQNFELRFNRKIKSLS